MNKPTPAQILAMPALSSLPTRAAVRGSACDLCGFAPEPVNRGRLLRVYHEHDEHDAPAPGIERIVYACTADVCTKRISDHARFYEQVTGDPGIFAICAGCPFRVDDWRCSNKWLKSNGGPGLAISVNGERARFRKLGVVCMKGAPPLPPDYAIACKGRGPVDRAE